MLFPESSVRSVDSLSVDAERCAARRLCPARAVFLSLAAGVSDRSLCADGVIPLRRRRYHYTVVHCLYVVMF